MCSLEGDGDDGGSHCVQTACLCTAMVEKLAHTKRPIEEADLLKVWRVLLEVLGDGEVDRAEDLYQQEYAAVRGPAHLFMPSMSEPGQGGAGASTAAGDSDAKAGSGDPQTPVLSQPQVSLIRLNVDLAIKDVSLLMVG